MIQAAKCLNYHLPRMRAEVYYEREEQAAHDS